MDTNGLKENGSAAATEAGNVLDQLQAAAAVLSGDSRLGQGILASSSRGTTPAIGGVPIWKRSAVERRQATEDLQAIGIHARPTVPGLKRSKVGSVCDLVEGLASVQEHENDIAELVIVCEPEQSSLMMGGLHPRGSLFERPVNVDTAQSQHAEFRKQLRAHGLRVLSVSDILEYNVEENVAARVDLEDLAFSALVYEMKAGYTVDDLKEEDREYVSDDYKRNVVEAMSITQLIDTIMINPTVHIMPSNRDTGLTATYTFAPLTNLVYTRDQQITTCRGVVMGRLRSEQRQREVQVMRFCFTKLGLPIAGEISEGGFLEGGDFFPVGTDLALLGIGLRSDMNACQQLMDKDLLGTRRFGVVRDDFDQSQTKPCQDNYGAKTSVLAEVMPEALLKEMRESRAGQHCTSMYESYRQPRESDSKL